MKRATLQYVIGFSALVLSACAGEENAQRLALKASTGVNDLKTHVDTTTGDYQFTRTRDYERLAELKAVTADIESGTNNRSAIWQATEAKSKIELMKIYSTMTPKAALAATAAQILIEPVPPFQPASLDPKKMETLVQKLGVLSRDPTLTERLVATTNYLLLVQQSYNDTVKKAKKDPGGKSDIPQKKSDAANEMLAAETTFSIERANTTPDTKRAAPEVLESYFADQIVMAPPPINNTTDAMATRPVDAGEMPYRMTLLPSPSAMSPTQEASGNGQSGDLVSSQALDAGSSLPSLDITKLRGSDLLTDRLIQNLYLQQ